MSFPFFIWTMQRTGGTSLAELLMEISEHPKAEHEPFNWRKSPRQFAEVAQNWAETRNEAALSAGLDEIFRQHYLIKHCYELHPGLTFHLMRAAERAGYRHILLLRRDEMSRLISKFIAEANGTWFRDYASRVYGEIVAGRRKLNPLPVRKVVEHYQFCRELTEGLREFMRDRRIGFFEIGYEDIYVGEQTDRLQNLERLLGFVGFGPEMVERHRSLIEEKIFQSAQNTASVVQFIPNLPEVIDALLGAGCPLSAEQWAGGAEFRAASAPDDGAGQADGPGNGVALPPERHAPAAPIFANRGERGAQQSTAEAVRRGPLIGAAVAAPEQPAIGLRSVLPEFGGIAGWLTPEEAEELFRLATEATSGCIVEIGSYRGRATMVLCAGSRTGAQLPVYAVDPHEKSVGAFGTRFGPKDRAAFFRNFFRTELSECVRLLNTTSAVVAPGWKWPVSLLYIAAARRYPSVAADFAAFQPHLVAGATVALHNTDVGDTRGAVERLLAAGALDRVREVGNLCILQFTGSPALVGATER